MAQSSQTDRELFDAEYDDSLSEAQPTTTTDPSAVEIAPPARSSQQPGQSASEAFIPDQETKSLGTVRDSSFRIPRPVRFSPRQGPLPREVSITDQETTSLGAVSDLTVVETSPSVNVSWPPDRAEESKSIAEQETKSLGLVRDSSSKIPRPVRFSSRYRKPASEISIPDQETTSMSAASAPSSAEVSQSHGLPRETTFIPDQETRSLTVVRVSTPPGSGYKSHSAQPGNSATAAEQETKPLSALQRSASDISVQSEANNPPGFLQRMMRVGLARLQEPQPEGLLTRGLQAVRPGTRPGLVPLLALANAYGLLLVSLSYYLSIWKYNYLIVEACFLGGLLFMSVPNIVRLLSRAPSRLERICLLCVLGMSFYLAHFMSSPLYFSSFDESLHWRTVDDILRTGHLFGLNSMLPVSPYYPGLELVTDAISTATGLNTFYAGNVVIIASRLLMILALYLFYEHITNSSRMASIALVIYMANPHFLLFDAIYSYETLALPLATFMIYILARYSDSDKSYRRVIATAWIVLAAVTVTHHMTDFFFDGLLLLWAGVSFFRPASRKTRICLTAIAVSGILLSLVYAIFLPGNPVWGYLSDYFGSAFNQLEQIITGSSSARPLFVSSGLTSPVWDKLLITGSVALVTFSLPFGLISLQRLHRNNALAVTFGFVALIYPLSQAFRFTSFGTEITDRAAAFLFLPIAYILTILLTHFWPTRQLTRRAIALISSGILVILLGNILAATGPALTGIPGPYLVVADARSIEPEGINAATWSLAYLGPANRVATDRINQMLMSTYGQQDIVTGLNDNIDVAPIFYSAQFDHADTTIMQAGQIRYLVVDTRLSTALPLVGTYFEEDAPHSIISRAALTKFNSVNAINRLFDSGDIVIYDTGAFINGSGP